MQDFLRANGFDAIENPAEGFIRYIATLNCACFTLLLAVIYLSVFCCLAGTS